MNYSRDESIFDAFLSGESVAALSERHEISSGRIGVIVKEFARRRNRAACKAETDATGSIPTLAFIARNAEKFTAERLEQERAERVDYCGLLRKYVMHVMQCEGTDFTGRLNDRMESEVVFSDSEVAELKRISSEAGNT